jgi:hypothetical protein
LAVCGMVWAFLAGFFAGFLAVLTGFLRVAFFFMAIYVQLRLFSYRSDANHHRL